MTPPSGVTRASSWSDRSRWAMIAALVACLAALALRLHRLAEPLMRWDEGWSVAHASRSVGEVIRIASWEVHPPLFYLLLKPWLALGRAVFVVRAFPVLVGCLAVALAYQVARQWTGRRSLACVAAGLTAVAPALVYYGQVTRMYSLVAFWLLLATWALLRWLARGTRGALAVLVLAMVAALYTLYYTVFPLLGLVLYGLVTARQRRRWLVAASALALLLYLPWVIVAAPGMLARMVEAAPTETIMPVTAWGLVRSVWTALTFDLSAGGWAALAVLVVLVAAACSHRPARAEARRLLLPLLTLISATVGIALASGTYFFAPRLFIPAVPFLLLLVAWALDSLARRSAWLLVAGLAVLVITYWPTSSHLVYEKNLEVSGPFDPHEYHALLSGPAAAEDLVFFNELALAGWYDLDRGPADPPWDYALRWTPIIEPMPQIRSRVEQAAAHYPRLWFVLYKGSFGPGRELKDWLDGALYPVTMDWGSESLFLSYIAPSAPMVEVSPGADFGDGLVRLEAARYSAQAGPRGELAVSLRWQALTDTRPNCRVVIQVWDEQGQVLAHRDVRPANWEQPSPRWRQGDVIEDRHGLLLTGRSGTPLHLAVSLYDEDTGQPLVVRGQDYLELGTLTESQP